MKIQSGTQQIAILPSNDKPTTPSLKEVADGFETLLTHQLLEEMQKSLEGESLFGGGVEGHTLGAVAQWELAGKLAGELDLGILEQLRLSAQAEQKGNS